MKKINSNSIYLIFAICRVLREFGFHKESPFYLIKSKNEPPVICEIDKRNDWKIKHEDFNKYYKFDKRMCVPRFSFGELRYNIFSYHDKDGYICTLPEEYQVIEFAERNRFSITDIKDLKLTLKELIYEYRKKTKQSNAFSKYLNSI